MWTTLPSASLRVNWGAGWRSPSGLSDAALTECDTEQPSASHPNTTAVSTAAQTRSAVTYFYLFQLYRQYSSAEDVLKPRPAPAAKAGRQGKFPMTGPARASSAKEPRSGIAKTLAAVFAPGAVGVGAARVLCK